MTNTNLGHKNLKTCFQIRNNQKNARAPITENERTIVQTITNGVTRSRYGIAVSGSQPFLFIAVRSAV